MSRHFIILLGSATTGFAKVVSAPKSVVISSIRDTPLFKIKSFLYQKYVEERLTSRQISAQIFSARSSVVRHLNLFEIPLRPEDDERKRRRSPAFGQRRAAGDVAAHKRELDITHKDDGNQERLHWISDPINIFYCMRPACFCDAVKVFADNYYAYNELQKRGERRASLAAKRA